MSARARSDGGSLAVEWRVPGGPPADRSSDKFLEYMSFRGFDCVFRRNGLALLASKSPEGRRLEAGLDDILD
jgi:hypothetical protein